MQPELLKQLKDVHLPPPISWWPPAPGWYIVFALFILLVCGVYFWLRKKRLRRQRKQRILQHMQQLQSTSDVAAAMVLVKQVAISQYPEQPIAELQGKAWIQFLTKDMDIPTQLQQQMLVAAYQKQPENCDALFQCLTKWVEQQL